MSKEGFSEALSFMRSNPMSYMATVEGDVPWNRAMFTVRAEDDFVLWFCTMASSNKVRQIGSNGNVCVAVWEGSKTCRVFGAAELIQDPQRKQELWDDTWESYFKGGKDDPEYSLVKVTPTRIEYQDVEKFGQNPIEVL